jgi:hypothetical protein
MRAAAIVVGGNLALAAVALAACGKSTKETPHGAGASAGVVQGSGGTNTAGGSVGGDGTGGSGDAAGAGGTGAGETGGSEAGGSGDVGSAGAGRDSGGNRAAGGYGAGKGGSAGRGGGAAGSAHGGQPASGGQAPVCNDHPGFVKITGELPGGFGSDTTLSAGCSDASLGTYLRPASYTQSPGDTGGKSVRVLACSDDGSLKIDLSFNFSVGNPVLQTGTLSYYVNGVLRGMKITELDETQKPVSDWTLVAPRSTDGVGQIYEASFSADGSPTGTPVSVSGAFSVCHVANLF